MVEKFYKPQNYNARKSIGYLMRTGSNQITSKIEAQFSDTELTFVQYAVLMHLRDDLAENCGELCNSLRYDSGALTRVIDQLENRKLLERHRCKNDRRVVKLKLTEPGRTMAESMVPIVVNQYNEWLKDFSQQEVEALIHLLTKLNNKISAT